MTKELLNVKMHSIKDCQEVIDEIANEHFSRRSFGSVAIVRG
jgi:predicted transcriptional regulator YheO